MGGKLDLLTSLESRSENTNMNRFTGYSARFPNVERNEQLLGEMSCDHLPHSNFQDALCLQLSFLGNVLEDWKDALARLSGLLVSLVDIQWVLAYTLLQTPYCIVSWALLVRQSGGGPNLVGPASDCRLPLRFIDIDDRRIRRCDSFDYLPVLICQIHDFTYAPFGTDTMHLHPWFSKIYQLVSPWRECQVPFSIHREMEN